MLGKNIIFLFILLNRLFSQSDYRINSMALQNNFIYNKINSFSYGLKNNTIYDKNLKFNMSLNTTFITNSGHGNLDNNSEIYSPGKSSRVNSIRLLYNNTWLTLELEPYFLKHKGVFQPSQVEGSYKYLNNNGINQNLRINDMGFRHSRIIIHYKSIGMSYGRMSHWWGPGLHSSITLSSNAASQKTFILGTFKDIYLGNFSFGAQIIVMPYISNSDEQLYFSGIKTSLTYHSDPKITLGFNRTYLSGAFNNLLDNTNIKSTWSIKDAIKLVAEPLFGSNKKYKDYTIPGTPGFDYWDQVLSGYLKLNFEKENIEIYFDVSSDDNRGNFTDLRAHWDHTLGYLIGVNKMYHFTTFDFFGGIEYLSLKKSNTAKFWRAYDDAYYAYSEYDYFTYKGRRIGAHSGSSSDDLIFILGFSFNDKITLLSYNKERHGIKSQKNPELKTEYSLSYQYNYLNKHTINLTVEYEHIENYGFNEGNISISKLLMINYSYLFSFY